MESKNYNAFLEIKYFKKSEQYLRTLVFTLQFEAKLLTKYIVKYV